MAVLFLSERPASPSWRSPQWGRRPSSAQPSCWLARPTPGGLPCVGSSAVGGFGPPCWPCPAPLRPGWRCMVHACGGGGGVAVEPSAATWTPGGGYSGVLVVARGSASLSLVLQPLVGEPSLAGVCLPACAPGGPGCPMGPAPWCVASGPLWPFALWGFSGCCCLGVGACLTSSACSAVPALASNLTCGGLDQL